MLNLIGSQRKVAIIIIRTVTDLEVVLHLKNFKSKGLCLIA